MAAHNSSEQPSKLRLYTKLGFGALVGFGMVGSLAGYRQGSAVVFVMTAVCWSLTQIVAQAIDAWRELHPPSTDDDPPSSPSPAA